MKLALAKGIAEDLLSRLEPSCERIVIAGSIRRQKPNVGDIELLCIPKSNGFIDQLDRHVETLRAFWISGAISSAAKSTGQRTN